MSNAPDTTEVADPPEAWVAVSVKLKVPADVDVDVDTVKIREVKPLGL